MPDLEVLQHPLSKWCHSKNSFRCDHITNRLPAEPSTPWNVRDSALHLPEGLCSMCHIRQLFRLGRRWLKSDTFRFSLSSVRNQLCGTASIRPWDERDVVRRAVF